MSWWLLQVDNYGPIPLRDTPHRAVAPLVVIAIVPTPRSQLPGRSCGPLRRSWFQGSDVVCHQILAFSGRLPGSLLRRSNRDADEGEEPGGESDAALMAPGQVRLDPPACHQPVDTLTGAAVGDAQGDGPISDRHRDGPLRVSLGGDLEQDQPFWPRQRLVASKASEGATSHTDVPKGGYSHVDSYSFLD